MGMFDNVLIEDLDLPDLPWEKIKELQKPKRLKVPYDNYFDGSNEALHVERTIFQTKSLDSSMSTYVLQEDGLFDRRYVYEDVPEEERPYYGTREWEEGDEKYREDPDRFLSFLHGPEYYQGYGGLRMVGKRDLNVYYFGDLTFYAMHYELDLPEEKANRHRLVEYVAHLDKHGLVRVHKPEEINLHRVYGGSYTTHPYEKNEN